MTERKRPPRIETESADPNAERLETLKDLYPEAFSEGKVDFDKLREALGDLVDDRPERYSFSWSGKRDAIRLLQTPSRATLRPAREESVAFDDTKHLFIEGDNLEVLKLLYKSYAGRVKMIYIDPPYNTGKDFIYPDNYADPLDTYLRLTGQKDAEGNVLTSNPETSGRYHSAWLSMMYPRLFVARQLLREDGVIFVSIDDHEVYNLRMAMNEVFGEENFVADIVWKSRKSEDARDKTGVSGDHEYILCYRRSEQGRLRGSEKDLEKFSNPDNDRRGPWRSADLTGLATRDRRPNLHYDLIDPTSGANYGCPNRGWRFDRTTMAKKISEGRVLWPSSPEGRPRHKLFVNEMQSLFKNMSSVITEVGTWEGTRELDDLLGSGVFDFPKPTQLLRILIEQMTEDEDLILDFFAGSCSAASATFSLNRNDGGNRRFLLVQLPEPVETGPEDRQKRYRTIAEVGCERMRRSIARMKTEREGQQDLVTLETPEDLGFRVFKLGESHFRRWTGTAEKSGVDWVEQMELSADPLLPGWKPEDVLWEIALREGLSLTCRIERLADVKTNQVWRITDDDKDQSLLVCLDAHLDPATPRALPLDKDTRFICRDAALSDELAANLALQCRLKAL